jgi:proteasome accessory factor B
LLTQAGIPYTFDHSTRRYAAERTILLPPVSLTHAEALALMLVTRNALGKHFVSDSAAAASAALKVESMLPQALQDYCGPLLELIEIRHDPASDPTSVHATMPILQSALIKRTKLGARYDSYFERRKIDVVLHPYRLAHIHRGWYLIAFTEKTSDIRTYKVERIVDLELLSERYRIDPTFNLDDYFGNAWLMIRGDRCYHVKIRFKPMVAGNVDEITWHKTQSTTYEDDGSLLFEADVDGIEEVSWWVLGYGDQAEVLEPPELRELLSRHALRMSAYYNGRRESGK